MSIINGRQVGGGAPLKTMTLVDENGVELFGFVVDKEELLTATPEKVIVGETFVSDYGVAVGEDTRTYRVSKAEYLILPGQSFSIPLVHYQMYDYTEFQCIIAKFNTTVTDSVYTDKISLGSVVYAVNSLEALSNVIKNSETESVDLGITNDTDDTYIIHYFTYRQEV